MNFDKPLDASTYCVTRNLDFKRLYAEFSQAVRVRAAKPNYKSEPVILPYCKIHFEPQGQCTVTDDRGMTIASGRNVTTSQLLSFILKRYW